MKYLVVINNDEALSNGDDPTFEDVKDEVEELLRSGYYDVEEIKVIGE